MFPPQAVDGYLIDLAGSMEASARRMGACTCEHVPWKPTPASYNLSSNEGIHPIEASMNRSNKNKAIHIYN